MQALEQFIQAQPDAWKKQVPEYERFEQALHTLVIAMNANV